MNPLTQFKKIPILPLLIALALVARSADAYLAAISDFNGDGHPDYVLENANTYQTAIWYLNNNVFVSDVHGPTLPTDWGVVGVADFNSDGHPDYLLYNFIHSADSDLVSIRTNIHQRRLWADHSQWVGLKGYGRL